MKLNELQEHTMKLSKDAFTPKSILSKLVEETNELAASIMKMFNKNLTLDTSILEEMVDVELLLEQFKFNNPQYIKQMDIIKRAKLYKVLKRMGHDTSGL